jgi:hypothetical protein
MVVDGHSQHRQPTPSTVWQIATVMWRTHMNDHVAQVKPAGQKEPFTLGTFLKLVPWRLL